MVAHFSELHSYGLPSPSFLGRKVSPFKTLYKIKIARKFSKRANFKHGSGHKFFPKWSATPLDQLMVWLVTMNNSYIFARV